MKENQLFEVVCHLFNYNYSSTLNSDFNADHVTCSVEVRCLVRLAKLDLLRVTTQFCSTVVAFCEHVVHHLNIITCDDEGSVCFSDLPDLLHLNRGLHWEIYVAVGAEDQIKSHWIGEFHIHTSDIAGVIQQNIY